MADRVLSIELGYVLTKVCEIERNGKTPRIISSFVLNTPEGMLMDGEVVTDDSFTNAFRNKLEAHNIKTRKAIFTIASSKIAAREATIPYVKEKQIGDIVRANLSDYFPVDPSKFMFAHSIIGVLRDSVEALPAPAEDEADEKKKKAPKPAPLGKPTGYKLLVLAAPKTLMASYEKLAKILNLDIESIDYNGNSIYQAAKEECAEGVQLIVKVDEKNALLMVLDDGAIALNRTIPYGINDAISAIRQSKDLCTIDSYEGALDVARRKTVIYSRFDSDLLATDSENENEALRRSKKEVTDNLRSLAGGILRVIEFYNSNHSTRPIEKAYITGIGADFSGLSTLLSHELGIKIKNLVHLAGIDIEKVFKDVTYGEYVTVIGASIDPLKFYSDQVESKSGQGAGKNSGLGTLVAILFLVLGIIAGAAMAAYAYFPYESEKKQKAAYEKTIADLEPAYQTYQEFLTSKQDVEYMRLLDEHTKSRNNEMLDFITYLETEMPYTLRLTTLSSDLEKISFTADVASKEETAYAIKALKDNPMFASIEVESVELVEEEELGEFYYEFTADCFFAPFEDPNADEAEEGEETDVVEEEAQ